MNENYNEKFKRVAGKRVKRLLKEIELLGNCGNRSHYSYSEKEIEHIFEVIETQLKEVRSRFIFRRSQNFEL